jgi:hypothetical protein
MDNSAARLEALGADGGEVSLRYRARAGRDYRWCAQLKHGGHTLTLLGPTEDAALTDLEAAVAEADTLPPCECHHVQMMPGGTVADAQRHARERCPRHGTSTVKPRAAVDPMYVSHELRQVADLIRGTVAADAYVPDDRTLALIVDDAAGSIAPQPCVGVCRCGRTTMLISGLCPGCRMHAANHRIDAKRGEDLPFDRTLFPGVQAIWDRLVRRG